MIEIVSGDITKQHIDAIVNAANRSLLGGGGVDGAIHRAAGPELLAECAMLDGCPTGEARMTGAYQLDAQAVIHTVGPIWRGGAEGEPELLAKCYETSLEFARMAHYESVAFPAISCGAYGYPIEAAARIAIETVADYLEAYGTPSLVRFVLFTDDALRAWNHAYKGHFGSSPSPG